MSDKLVASFLIILACITLWSVDSFAQDKSVPLQKYLKPIQLDSLDAILLLVDVMYRDHMNQQRIIALTQAYNEALSKTGAFTTGEVNLQKLDIFNFFYGAIGYDDSTNKIQILFYVSNNIVNTRTSEGLKQFMASCFAPLTNLIGKLVSEFDEKRDLYVEFYSMENPEKKIAKYENGAYIF
jgi:hypothetical protein